MQPVHDTQNVNKSVTEKSREKSKIYKDQHPIIRQCGYSWRRICKEWCASGKRCQFIMGFDSDMIDLNMNEENDNNPSPIGEPALSPEDLPDWYDMENPLCNRGFDLGGFICVHCQNACHRGCLSVSHSVQE